MNFEEIKKQLEIKGWGVVEVNQSGSVVYAKIYSKNGKKILETTNGEKWDTIERVPLPIAASRVNDYVETDEPVDPNAFVNLELTENSEN